MAQFHQPHTFFPRFRLILEDELPELLEGLVEAGCASLDALALMPPSIEDRSPRPGDERFQLVTGRRPVVEGVLARAVEEHEGVTIRRGIGVARLLTGGDLVSGVPNVRGVRTTDGEDVPAALVVVAMRRRTKLPEWLLALGGTPPLTDAEDCRFAYYTQYFRGSALPQVLGPPVADIGTFS